MRKEEIDPTAWVWTLPANRSKNGKPRVTPIVGLARELIEAKLGKVPRGPLFITETEKPLAAAHVGHALLKRRKRFPVLAFTTHDLRRTVATMLAEMAVPLELVAALVGHESGAKEVRTLVRHYVKSDQIERKKAALEAWDKRLRAIISAQPTAENVTDISEARSLRASA